MKDKHSSLFEWGFSYKEKRFCTIDTWRYLTIFKQPLVIQWLLSFSSFFLTFFRKKALLLSHFAKPLFRQMFKQNACSTNCIVNKMTNWQNDWLTKYLVDEKPFWQNDKWQYDKRMKNTNDSQAKLQVYRMTCIENDRIK